MKQARIRVILLALCDAFFMVATFIAVAYIYRCFGGDYYLKYYLGLAPLLLIYLVSNGMIRLYHGNFFYPGAMMPPQEELRRLVFSVTMTYLLTFAYLLIVQDAEVYSRFVLLASWAINCVLAMPARNLMRIIMKKCNIGQIPIIVAGAGKSGCMLAETLAQDEHYGFRVAGFLDDTVTETPEGCPPVIGKVADAIEIGKQQGIDYMICCLPGAAVQQNLKAWLKFFRHLTIIPTNQILPGAWAYPTNFDHLTGIEFRNQLLLPGPRIAKTILEVIMSFFGIICLVPLFLVLAILVKLTSRGPIMYAAKRLGLNGKEIRVWKFRTMRQDADEYLKKMLEKDPVLAAEWKEKFKLENDPRITPFGKFLRKTSLDELPQLFNVLTGEMAMIGPRPIVRAEVAYYGENYEVFSRVKPGITGLWQISGRSETTYEQRVNFDLAYIMNWSIWLDIYILMRTVLEVLRCRGAK